MQIYQNDLNKKIFVLEPDDARSIQSVIHQMQAGDVLQLKRGTYHTQINVSGKKHIRLEAFPGDEGRVEIDGLRTVDWIWALDPDTGIYSVAYPGYSSLFHWQGDHEGEAFNNKWMYPVLATIGLDPLLWQPEGVASLEPGQFYINSAPDAPGTIYVRLNDGQGIESFRISPFDRLLWGDEDCDRISLIDINFMGCSNTGKTGAINTPGRRWYLENVTVSLANTIGIELGQGGARSNMKSRTVQSTFVNVNALRCGQMGWWGAADHATFENCGHIGSNWKGFDHWWEASHKFESCSHCLIIHWYAKDCRGPGFWFDIDNTNNTLIAPKVENCVRTGIELELGASNNYIYNAMISGVHPEIIHPDKPWDVAAGIVIKADSNENEINGAVITGCKEAIRIDNQDSRGLSDNNTVLNLVSRENDRDVKVLGDRLRNRVMVP